MRSLLDGRSEAMMQDDDREDPGSLGRAHRSTRARFETKATDLRRILQAPAASEEELMLRTELRRAVGELGSLFEEAASADRDVVRSYAFSRFAQTAKRIAKSDATPSRHVH